MKILIVCQGNHNRSPLLMGIFQKLLGNEHVIESAGVHPFATQGLVADEHVLTVLRAVGVDITNHRGRHIDAIPLTLFDYILCAEPAVTNAVKRKLPEHTRVRVETFGSQNGIPDPIGSPLSTYQQYFRLFWELAEEWCMEHHLIQCNRG